MPETGQRISFVELLDNYRRVKVPQLQRDYAQGRASAKEVRDGFLKALEEALMLSPDDQSLPLNLDFVYGSIEEDGDEFFLPLDGQQRLTTLFLLHWYLAWRDRRLEDFRETMSDGHRSRFSYAVRPSSTEFFDELVQYVPEEPTDCVTSVRQLIENQPWFYLNWRLDSTIQSALTMLDAIHARFSKQDGLFSRLIDRGAPAITFQLLPLEHFGLSDDLYIKMNARGKPLTRFETFKARFEQHLTHIYKDEKRQIGDTELPIQKFFARRMDTEWADFFWSQRTPRTAIFDAAVMNLFWIVALASINPDERTNATPAITYRQRAGSYAEFDELGLLTRDFGDNLICLLEAWSGTSGELRTQLPDERYFDEVAFFKKVSAAPQNVPYGDLVQFAAFVSYVSANEESRDPQRFQEWMRVIFNLVQNSDIERPEEYERSLSGLRKLLPYSDNILQYLATDEQGYLGFSREQVHEESIKARLLVADGAWRRRIDAAESHGYFRGQVGFLLEFSGVYHQAGEQAIAEWGRELHRALQGKFDEYLDKATATFEERGLIELGGAPYQWERSLLAVGDYLLRVGGSNRSFLTNRSSNTDSWKRFLRNGRGRQWLRQLWDQLDLNVELPPQLGEIRTSAELEPWRSVFVRYPDMIGYCGENQIRWTSDGEVYLLRRKQMNGFHAELFTYWLFKRWEDGELSCSFLDAAYVETMGTSEEPRVRLSAGNLDSEAIFEVHFARGRYRVSAALSPEGSDPSLLEHLAAEGYVMCDGGIQKFIGVSGIDEALQRLDLVMVNAFGEGDS